MILSPTIANRLLLFRYGTLATGGSDGTVAVWDHRAKKRLKLYNRLPTAISALAFNDDGSKLAIGVSSMQDVTSDDRKEELKQKGDDPNHVSIVVRTVGEELKVSIPPYSDPGEDRNVSHSGFFYH